MRQHRVPLVNPGALTVRINARFEKRSHRLLRLPKL